MNITRGIVPVADRNVIYGPPGVGKTSFACGCAPGSHTASPKVLALSWEDGTNHLDVARVEGPSTWEPSLRLIADACTTPGDHTDVVVDTVDRLETQAAQFICERGKKASLGDFGYGDGFEALSTKWKELLFALNSARVYGRNVWLVAHEQMVTIDNPELGKYSQWIPILNKRTWASTHQWADNVYSATHEGGVKDKHVFLTGNRVLRTQAGSGYVAKNRHDLPPVLPLDPRELARAIASRGRTPDDIRAAIRSICPAELLPTVESVLLEDGDDTTKLAQTEKVLQNKIAKQPKETSK
jgi:hypothetical protein